MSEPESIKVVLVGESGVFNSGFFSSNSFARE